MLPYKTASKSLLVGADSISARETPRLRRANLAVQIFTDERVWVEISLAINPHARFESFCESCRRQSFTLLFKKWNEKSTKTETEHKVPALVLSVIL